MIAAFLLELQQFQLSETHQIILIEWFAGGGTTTSVIGTGVSINGLGGGEYSVRVTNDDTGCAITERVTVNNNILQPELSASADPVTTLFSL